jgi:predicted ATP-binding protein involved in virulence
MRIKQLRLKNFRGIKNLELNFDVTQPVAVLVGINGAGKSSVLDCIGSLIRSYSLIAVGGGVEYIFQDRDIHIGKGSTCNSLCGIFENNDIFWGIEKNIYEHSHIKISQDAVELIKSTLNRYGSKYFVSIYYLANRKSVQMQPYDSLDTLTASMMFSIMHPEGIKSSSDISDIIDFQEFTNWFQKLEDLENETRLSIDNNHRDIKLESTRKAIYSMLGDGFSNLRMKRAIDKLTIHKANKEIELDWLSDGERGLLALAGDLARRLATTYPDSVNPLNEAGLVLIDEIELHLHPEWQRIIIQRLTQTFPGCQFIVTTHSPQVLSNVQPECIHILAIEDNNVVVKRPERSYGRDSNRILEDIMGVSKRPPEIEARILELFRIIHDGELDRAKDLIQDLATEIGIDEPELIRAASTIHRREVIGR